MRNLTENAVADKSLAFALRVIALYKYLCAEKNEYVLSKQVLRSGTSIGANIAEAQCAVSRKDFLSKLYIAFKECSETKYWLELLFRSDYICLLYTSDAAGMFGNEVLVGAAVQVGLY